MRVIENKVNKLRLYKESLAIDLSDVNNEFVAAIHDLLEKDEVCSMAYFRHHMRVNRFQHVLSVAYLSYAIAKKKGLNYKETARAALLHDLFYYDMRDSEYPKHHNSVHAKVALENAEKIIPLSETEKDIILGHMWPMGGYKPKTPEGKTVCGADKFCSVVEFFYSFFSGRKRALRRRIEKIKRRHKNK